MKEKVKTVPIEHLANAPAEHHRAWHFVDLTGLDITPEDCFKPETWRYVQHWSRRDIVEIYSDDGWELLCRVMQTGNGFAVLKELSRNTAPVEYDEPAFDEPRVGLSPGIGWRTFDETGRELGRFSAKADAKACLAEYLVRKTAAAA